MNPTIDITKEQELLFYSLNSVVSLTKSEWGV